MSERIHQLVDEIQDLPTLPDVVAKINRLVGSPDTSASDITEAIGRDVALSAKILKLVNSPFYGFPRRITNITYAVVILGFRAVRNLALSAFVFDSFGSKSASKNFDVAALWDHSIGVGLCASLVAEKILPQQTDDAFMGGLLHDVGKVVMNQHLPADLCEVAQCVHDTDSLFLDCEAAALEYDHARLGGLLMERWNLPPVLVHVVQGHHAPESVPEEARMLTGIVHFSDILTRALLFGSGGDRKIPLLAAPAFERLGLGWTDVAALMGKARREMQKAEAFYALA